ncbi:putative phosphatidylglycerol/phosphatidylinositol transfer protein [Cinnamomum micranthum f. kanehirae]|uniref:Putative phosphatidylglycerol/phosphatidylinositol transfer protein n=1 Tax=Cinnamomum micranthum f. kanehirae TaxID=337451 RepID=A0A3S4NQQ5_9MAGN|nr:putative phosphatidylglycerol/phosphatidylinositol transfer protein [Cinnamomum micranthum f. kanehirae]
MFTMGVDKNDEYAVKVKGVDMSPDPVVRGKPATFRISASTDKAISGGKLVIEVRYFGVHIHTESHSLCEETSCPISTGDFVLSHTQTLPGYTPPGSYTLKMKMLGESGHQLTCINFDFKIQLGSPFADS